MCHPPCEVYIFWAACAKSGSVFSNEDAMDWKTSLSLVPFCMRVEMKEYVKTK